MAGISGDWQSAPMQQWAEMEEAIQREQNKDLLTSWGCKEAVMCKGELFLWDISACVQLFTGSDGVSMTHQWAGLALHASLETSSLLLPNEVFWIKDKKLQPQSSRSLEMIAGTQQARGKKKKKKKAESWSWFPFPSLVLGKCCSKQRSLPAADTAGRIQGQKEITRSRREIEAQRPHTHSAVSDCIHISQAQFK